MASRSARVSRERPFYLRHADAYDELITDPVEPWVAAVHSRAPGADLLDAGCGTGRHAAAFRALGHHVELADASPALLALAARRCPGARTHLVDLCSLGLASAFAAVTCRGVLNDMITDGERQAAVTALAAALRPGGALFLDVREEGAARRRADGTEHTRTAGALTFTSRTTWRDGLLMVDERYGDAAYHFRMRPWSAGELEARLTAAGLRVTEIGPGAGRRTPDRLFVVAQAPPSAA
ncbi:methyltransferase domain-containing protein [Symbioplanes lichenis]|uniref:methyltransferase domain-containing protein n=1 Tax=Symbioplanes lichenis TaxID=1629072 RepID=UPI002739A3D6|nr:methyltransferase domain-containing protein [Actinoplanes lichenis]